MSEMAPNGTMIWSPEDLVWECARRASEATVMGDLNGRDFFRCCGAAISAAHGATATRLLDTLPKHAYVRHDGDTAGCAVCGLHRTDPIHAVEEADHD